MDTARSRAKIIVIIDWILLLIVAALFFGMILYYYYYESQKSYPLSFRNYRMNDASIYGEIMLVLTVGVLIILLLNFLLTFAVHHENGTCCKVGYVISIVGIGFQVWNFVETLLTSIVLDIGIHGLVLAYRIYSVKTIINFSKELTLNREATIGISRTGTSVPDFSTAR